MTTDKIEGSGKVSIEIDLAAFVGNVWQNDDGEYHDNASSIRDQIIERAADKIRHDLIEDVRKSIRATVEPFINAQVGEIIKDTLDGEFRPVNGYGEPSRVPITLRAQIGAEATAWLTKKADRYGNGPSNLESIIKLMVDRQLAKEFLEIIAAERAKIVVQLRGAAAELLAKEAAKR